MDILKKLTEELGIKLWQTEAAVKLIDEGNTIPFISRYRKEATGSLNDEILRNLKPEDIEKEIKAKDKLKKTENTNFLQNAAKNKKGLF